MYFVFAIFWPVTSIFRKLVKSPDNSHNGKIFQNWNFHLKYVLDHSESIPIKKNVDQKFLSLWFFSTYEPIFRQNGYVPEKTFFTWGTFFKIDIVVLDTFWSIDQKNFRKLFDFGNFFATNRSIWYFNGKILIIFSIT